MTAQTYLDFNATAPIRQSALETVTAAYQEGGNASSVHMTGRAAKARVDAARKAVATLAGAEPGWVIFCGSGTEADNQVLRCSGADTVLISTIEHEAIMLARPDSKQVPVGHDGVIDLDALEQTLSEANGQVLVSVMTANNETGIIQPIEEITRLAHAKGALVHTDAIQAAGKIPVDMAGWGVDFMSLSAHKIGGPQGVGALLVKDRTLLDRFVHGGGQESDLRAGTENVPGISGFGAAAIEALEGLDNFVTLSGMRDALEDRVRALDPSVTVFGGNRARLPNTSKFATPGLSSETQVMGLDLAGVAISAGSACSAGRVEPPYVLKAMGIDDALSTCAIRVSLGWTTTNDDIDRFVTGWEKIRNRNLARADKKAG